MTPTDSKSRSWAKLGCFGVIGAAILLVLVLGIAAGVALFQNRSATSETRELEQSVPLSPRAVEPALPLLDESPSVPARIVLDFAVTQATIVPGPPGAPIRIEADYDTSRFELRQETTEEHGEGWITRISLLPIGSPGWELFRVKLGARPPWVRITLPRDVPIDLEGEFVKGFVAMELGGLWIRTVDLEVSDGAAELSFYEPLREPMDRIEVRASTGALEISSLGNASPASASITQRLGALGLDLRGAWLRDAEIHIQGGRASGGSIWLPSNTRIEGLETAGPFTAPGPVPEIEPPTLRFDMPGPQRNLIVIK